MSRETLAFSIGLLRVFLATLLVFPLVETHSQPWLVGAYSAIGLALIFGVLLIAGRPRFIREESLASILVDSLTISLLVGATGGEKSLFFALYLLATPGISRTPDVARRVAGSVILIVGYLAAIVISVEAFGMPLSPAAGFEVVLLALSCAVAAALGAKLRGTGDNGQRILSTLARERQYAEKAEALFRGVGPLLETLSPEGVVGWTAQSARKSLGAPYAHVATLDGHLHQTSTEGDREVYPSWWHPEIQRLLLWSCRTGEVAHNDKPVHGMERFVAVPLSLEGGGSVGAIILGGRSFSPEEERTLELLAGQVAPILGRADGAPGRSDPILGVPNRDSLHRVLRRELSRSKPLTILAVDLSPQRNQANGRGVEDFPLRLTVQALQESQQYVFCYAEDTFIALSDGASTKEAVATALEIQRVVEHLTGNSDLPKIPAVGFTTTGAQQLGGPSLLLDAALEALVRAKSNPDKIAGPPASAGDRSFESLTRVSERNRIPQEIQALAEAIEVRDPDLGDHSRAVSRLASLVGSRMPLSKEQMEALVHGALLHDIGKIGISDDILHKPASLSVEEYEAMKQHPLLGARILGSIPELSHILPAVKHHHERFDGKGYPEGLRGEYIPLVARIISVADALETITRDRPYRQGRSEEEALYEILRNSGTQFDPEVIRTLQEVAGKPDIRKLSS